jgi:hypothetical protein
MSGSSGGFGTGFPNAPFVDGAGNVTPVWRNFLLALYRRTGSEPGVNPASVPSQGSLIAETSARQAADAALALSLQAETDARIAADAAEAQMRQAMDDWLVSTSGWQAALATETAARVAGDQWTAGPVHTLGTGLVLSAGVLSASGGYQLLVNGDVPVGIICDGKGRPFYVPA